MLQNKMTLLIACLLIFCAVFVVAISWTPQTNSPLRIETISTAELSQLLIIQPTAGQGIAAMTVNEQSSVLLVDVRSEPEIAVSIIPGALTKAQFEDESHLYKDQIIVPYCTIGVRSASYAEELSRKGFHTKNYQGSILQWVASELPLVTIDGTPTDRVHTYSNEYQVPASYTQVAF